MVVDLVMDPELEKAAKMGDISFLEKAQQRELENGSGEYFLRQNSPRKQNILHISIRRGSNEYEFIKEVVERFPRAIIEKLVNQGDRDGDTPLHVVAFRGYQSYHRILKLFLEHDEDGQQEVKFAKQAWRVHNSDGNTPLHLAVEDGNIEVVKLLVGQHPDLACVGNGKDGNTPFHLAVIKGEIEAVKWLLEKHPDLAYDRNNKNGNISHHFAAAKGHIDILKLLLEYEHGDKVAKLAWREENADGNTPFHVAIIKGKVEVVNFMLEHDPDLLAYGGNNKDGNTLLHLAAIGGEINILKQILDKVAEPTWKVQNADGNTPLHVALIKGNLHFAILLVEQHSDDVARVTNNLKETPLHLAIKHHYILEDDKEVMGKIEQRQPVKVNEIPSMIKLLVEKESCVLGWHDAEGFTPLHRVAFLHRSLNLRVIRFMLDRYSQSAEVVDSSGKKTILHFMINRIVSYKEGKEFLQFPGIDGLRNCKDQQGNTPLDLAWKMNIKMVRALLDSPSTQQTVKGIPTKFIVQHLDEYDQMIEIRKMTTEEYGVVNGENIQFLKEKLCKFGMNFLLSRDSKGRNVLHNLMQLERGSLIIYDEFVDFVKQVVNSYPILVCQTDFNRETPLHILMRNSPDTQFQHKNEDDHDLKTSNWIDGLLLELLKLCQKYFHIAKEEAEITAGSANGGFRFKYDPPWLVQNVEGNTPLHEAIKQALKVVRGVPFGEALRSLMKMDIKTTARLANKQNEIPLHLLCQHYCFEVLPDDEIKSAVEAYEGALSSTNQDGLTPILIAAQARLLEIVMRLADIQPDLVEDTDKNGQTIWHLLVNQDPEHTQYLLDYTGAKWRETFLNQLKEKNNAGKTPLHVVLEGRRFGHAELIMKSSLGGWSSERKMEWMRELVDIKDGDGTTPGHLLAAIPDLPESVEKVLRGNPLLSGHRSVYGGISTTEMKDNVNTMGVVAALLTTITFTAAFTVPGGSTQQDNNDIPSGLNKKGQDEGTPILVKNVAFQAFMFFDITSMCLSTMVLFCLLWILFAGTKRNSMMLMDFSILLLQLSFFTTLLTFMTGLYATTFQVQPWIAIYTLVLCSLLMLLIMRRNIFIKFLVPFGQFNHLEVYRKLKSGGVKAKGGVLKVYRKLKSGGVKAKGGVLKVKSGTLEVYKKLKIWFGVISRNTLPISSERSA